MCHQLSEEMDLSCRLWVFLSLSVCLFHSFLHSRIEQLESFYFISRFGCHCLEGMTKHVALGWRSSAIIPRDGMETTKFVLTTIRVLLGSCLACLNTNDHEHCVRPNPIPTRKRRPRFSHSNCPFGNEGRGFKNDWEIDFQAGRSWRATVSSRSCCATVLGIMAESSLKEALSHLTTWKSEESLPLIPITPGLAYLYSYG